VTTSTRHPLDPDPVRATKATAVFSLGLLSVVTGPFLGGVIPATLALLMARESHRELVAAEGFLLGARRLRSGVRLAWTGIVLAIAGLVVVSIIGLLHYARQRGTDFDPTVN
jgi:small-conductance mechanosensitive channel